MQDQAQETSQEGSDVKTKTKKNPAAKAGKSAKKAAGRAKKENRPRNIEPHSRHPEVESLPYKWQPGSRGRPPSGWGKDKEGKPVPGKGWIQIAGKWHKPMDGKAKKAGAKSKAGKKAAPKKSGGKKKAPAKKGGKKRK